jgi:hyperosmotically inducible protein
MSMKKIASAAAVAALFALPLAGHAQQQSAGTLMKDSAITAKIKAAQAADSTVRATRIDVETDNNGVVTLSGTARSQAEIDRAAALARGVEGVTSVNNNMRLASTAGNGTGSTGATTTTTPSDASTTSGTMRAPRSDRG